MASQTDPPGAGLLNQKYARCMAGTVSGEWDRSPLKLRTIKLCAILLAVVDELELDLQLCFALHAASRATTAVYRPVLDELGLTYPQYLAMLALWERDGISVSDLGARLQLDSGTLSPLVKRLEGLALVERHRSSSDERRVDVDLTQAGRDLRKRAVAVPRRLAAAAGLSLDELVELRETLVRLTDSLHDYAQQHDYTQNKHDHTQKR